MRKEGVGRVWEKRHSVVLKMFVSGISGTRPISATCQMWDLGQDSQPFWDLVFLPGK